MTQITQVHMVGGYQHDHIASVRWKTGGSSGESTRAQMVEFIEGGGKAYVTDGANTAYVGVVKATPKFIRTYADGKWTDNLLALPRF
jgi:hypothetical protein